jgi:hypothetical protein
MKNVVVTMLAFTLSLGSVFAGENPNLFREIQRKIKVDLSEIKLDKTQENFVLVQFQVIDQEIKIVSLTGSKNELTELMICELEEMFINADTDPNKIYQFKFNFTQE